MYDFERLRVWQKALEYDDLVCAVVEQLPPRERFGLTQQIRRASASIGLNIAEGSTSQSDREKQRFLGYAIRSLLETVAGQKLAQRRGYELDEDLQQRAYAESEQLFRQLQSFRATVRARAAHQGKRRP